MASKKQKAKAKPKPKAEAKPKPKAQPQRPKPAPIVSADQAEDTPEGGLHGGFDRVKAQMTGQLLGQSGRSDEDKNLPPEAENAGLQAGDVLGSGRPVDSSAEGSNSAQPQFDKHSQPAEA